MLIRAGETWAASIGGVYRKVEIIERLDATGFWMCIDLETGISFTARERWFIERTDETG